MDKINIEFLEQMETIYQKQKRDAFTLGTILGVCLGMLLTLLIILIF